MTPKVATDLPERLQALHRASQKLDRERVDVLARVRLSLRELRRLGTDLAHLRASDGTASLPPESDAAALAARFGLTRREVEVALLLIEGHPNSAIAAMLQVSSHTARHHTQHVLSKLGVRSRARAAALLHDTLAMRRRRN